MCIVAYVSGHGFGHAAREIEILRRLPADIPLVLKTSSPEWFWRAGMGRPFEYVSDAFDVGCVQHDGLRIDVSGTLAAWREVDARNRARRAAETADLRRRGARVVLSDVAAFPLTLAADLGLPGLLVANFTWADIYAAFVPEEPGFAPAVEDLTAQYVRGATVCLETEMSVPMAYLPRIEPVGLVCRPGRPRRDELLAALPPEAADRRLALVYLGAWGYPLPYPRLETFRDWFFVSVDAPPVPVANWGTVPRDGMPHPDLVASVDLVVSKPGYGIAAECLSTGTPLLYCPRPAFAEYGPMDAALSAWPGGTRLPVDSFLSLDWDDALARVPDRASVPVLPAAGGANAAREIVKWYASAT